MDLKKKSGAKNKPGTEGQAAGRSIPWKEIRTARRSGQRTEGQAAGQSRQLQISGRPWVIFDMDGTLWDTIDVIVSSWNRIFSSLPDCHAHASREVLLGYMGKTMDAFARGLLPDLPFEESAEIIHRCEKLENETLREKGGVLYPGADHIFADLSREGYETAIVSNCQTGYIDAFLDFYGFRDKVADYLCFGDTGFGKAENLRLLKERHGIAACCYIGDTEGDYQACLQAQVPFVWAAYGFGKVSGTARIDSLKELPGTLPDVLGKY